MVPFRPLFQPKPQLAGCLSEARCAMLHDDMGHRHVTGPRVTPRHRACMRQVNAQDTRATDRTVHSLERTVDAEIAPGVHILSTSHEEAAKCDRHAERLYGEAGMRYELVPG